MDIDVITGAGGTIDLGGRKLLLRQLTIGDIGKLTAWLKERAPRPYQVAAQRISDLSPIKEIDPDGYAAEREKILLEARELAKKGALADTDGANEIMMSVEGVAMMVWLSVLGEQPDITYEWVVASIEREDILGIKNKIDSMNQQWEQYVPKNSAAPVLRPG